MSICVFLVCNLGINVLRDLVLLLKCRFFMLWGSEMLGVFWVIVLMKVILSFLVLWIM